MDNSITKIKQKETGFYSKIIESITEKPKTILLFLAIFFAIIYSFLAFQNPKIFNSPDESANYFFGNLFATQNKLSYDLDFDSDILHPRSMLVVDQKIVPSSFLGLPLIYGILAKIFGSNAILFFTPIISIIATLFFYQIIKIIFSKKIAFLSTILVFINPAFWYYATHSMYHNILFLSFFIVGIYFFVKTKQYNEISYLNVLAGSFFTTLALMVRTSEAPWVFLVLVFLWSVNKKKFQWRRCAVAFLTFVILVIPILLFNTKLYGHPLSSGYYLFKETNNTQNLNNTIGQTVLRGSIFGQDFISNIWQNFWNYGIYIFWWFGIPTLLGIFIYFKKIKIIAKKEKIYLALFLLVSIYLIIYYGSWMFNDHPDPSQITTGTSYVRYWLPIYIFSTPFLSAILLYYKKNVKSKYLSKIFVFGVVVVVCYNFLFIFKLTDESIMKRTGKEYMEIKQKVLDITEINSVIVANYYDKFLFPDRLVIENIDEDREKKLSEIKKILDNNYTVYYYSWHSDEDIKYLNDRFLSKYNLEFTDPKNIREGERLFEVIIN